MKLCIALDMPSLRDIIYFLKKIKEYDDVWLKVGFRSFIRDSKDILKAIKDINPNFKIFLDLKLFDIPNTIADGGYEISNLGVDMFNIHASSGKEAMQRLTQRLKTLDNRPLVLAITALTSFDDRSFYEIYGSSIADKSISFAKDAYDSGIDGVVCSAFESLDIKNKIDKNFITLTPGIRLNKIAGDDQKRVATIKDAKDRLVDFIVVGRPIYSSKDPKMVVDNILEHI